jgi:hypothetical protein
MKLNGLKKLVLNVYNRLVAKLNDFKRFYTFINGLETGPYHYFNKYIQKFNLRNLESLFLRIYKRILNLVVNIFYIIKLI